MLVTFFEIMFKFGRFFDVIFKFGHAEKFREILLKDPILFCIPPCSRMLVILDVDGALFVSQGL